MDKVLITGATGFIGRILTEKLAGRCKVRCLLRKGSDESVLPDDVEIWRGNLKYKESLEGICEDFDKVFHLAILGMRKYKKGEDVDLIELNKRATENLLWECKKEDIKKFVYFSSLAVLGKVPDRENLSNEMVPDPRSDYGRAKLVCEHLVKKYSENSFDVLILRPSMVYDFTALGEMSFEHDFHKIYRHLKRRVVPMVGSGKNKVNVIDRNELVKSTVDLVESETGNEIINGETLTFKELIDTVAEETDIRYYVKIPIPFKLLDIILPPMEKIYRFFSRKPPLTKKGLERIRNNVVG